jgi:hypothetical protein
MAEKEIPTRCECVGHDTCDGCWDQLGLNTCFVRPERRAMMRGLSVADILKLDHRYGPCDSPTCPHEHVAEEGA